MDREQLHMPGRGGLRIPESKDALREKKKNKTKKQKKRKKKKN